MIDSASVFMIPSAGDQHGEGEQGVDDTQQRVDQAARLSANPARSSTTACGNPPASCFDRASPVAWSTSSASATNTWRSNGRAGIFEQCRVDQGRQADVGVLHDGADRERALDAVGEGDGDGVTHLPARSAAISALTAMASSTQTGAVGAGEGPVDVAEVESEPSRPESTPITSIDSPSISAVDRAMPDTASTSGRVPQLGRE
jgi:hypothetical protein